MQTTIKNVGTLTIVSLDGNIDFETCDYIAEDLKKKLSQEKSENIILDMHKLDFVGSSGIERFMHILKNIFGESPRCIGVKSEFKRCFKVFSHNRSSFKYYSNIEEAIEDFENQDTINNDEEENTITC